MMTFICKFKKDKLNKHLLEGLHPKRTFKLKNTVPFQYNDLNNLKLLKNKLAAIKMGI